jgi:hypothetical protein
MLKPNISTTLHTWHMWGYKIKKDSNKGGMKINSEQRQCILPKYKKLSERIKGRVI